MSPLIANKVTEKDVRDWLDENGYFGRSAKIWELELYAIGRPGWKQVFRFSVDARKREESVGDAGENTDENANSGDDRKDNDGNSAVTLFGVVQDDERNSLSRKQTTRICVFEEAHLQEDFLSACTTGMMIRGSRSQDNPVWILLGGFCLIVIVFFLMRLFS